MKNPMISIARTFRAANAAPAKPFGLTGAERGQLKSLMGVAAAHPTLSGGQPKKPEEAVPSPENTEQPVETTVPTAEGEVIPPEATQEAENPSAGASEGQGQENPAPVKSDAPAAPEAASKNKPRKGKK